MGHPVPGGFKYGDLQIGGISNVRQYGHELLGTRT
jgi:hypothetical protein